MRAVESKLLSPFPLFGFVLLYQLVEVVINCLCGVAGAHVKLDTCVGRFEGHFLFIVIMTSMWSRVYIFCPRINLLIPGFCDTVLAYTARNMCSMPKEESPSCLFSADVCLRFFDVNDVFLYNSWTCFSSS